jgi:hypothetical protein
MTPIEVLRAQLVLPQANLGETGRPTPVRNATQWPTLLRAYTSAG